MILLDRATSDPSFIVVCRSGGDYNLDHAKCIRRQFYAHNRDQRFKFYCITDTPSEDWHVPMETKWHGWWSVLEAYRFTGPTILVGLDTLIRSDLKPFTDMALNCPKDTIYGIHDFLRPKWSDAVTLWNGDHRGIAANFDIEQSIIKPNDHSTVWGIMDYAARQMVRLGIKIGYMDDQISGIILHGEHVVGRNRTPKDEAKIVCWAVHPRPWNSNSWAGDEYRSYMK